MAVHQRILLDSGRFCQILLSILTFWIGDGDATTGDGDGDGDGEPNFMCGVDIQCAE
jgi:hypothetical protein